MVKLTPVKREYVKGLQCSISLALNLPGDEKWKKFQHKRNVAFRQVNELFTEMAFRKVKKAKKGQEENTVNFAGSALLFLNDGHELYSGSFYGRRPSVALCRPMAEAEPAIMTFHLEQQLELIRKILKATGRRRWLPHKTRRAALDKVIKDLLLMGKAPLKSYQTDPRQRAVVLARAYIMRSRLIRPKGFTVPAKKIEGLEQALTALNDGWNDAKDSDARDEDPVYLRLKAQILYDQLHVSNEVRDIQRLNDTLETLLCLLDEPAPEDFPLILWYARHTGDTTHVDVILEQSSPLQKLAAAALLNCREPVIQPLAASAIAELKEQPFSHDDWQTMITLLEKHACLKPFIGDVWEAARGQERCTTSGYHLRWYWSRQQALYDMAFAAADTPKRKAEIADSLKGRPVLQRQAVEELARRNRDDSLKQYLEVENSGLMGHYIKQLPKKPVAPASAVAPAFPATPAPWIAVHFFIREPAGKRQAAAIVHNATSDEWTVHEFPELDTLWQHYLRWQNSYHQLGATGQPKEESAPYLLDLVGELGGMFGFLFDLPQDQPVVFIPHGFLHLAPLHMALKQPPAPPPETKNKQDAESKIAPEDIWAYKRRFTYLPAWASGYLQNYSPAASGKTPCVVEHFSGRYNAIIQKMPGICFVPEAKGRDVLALPPDLTRLALLCHGIANPVSPFDSGLKLSDSALTLQAILGSSLRFSGTSVLLGACETDMVGAAASPLDEHLSISAALLEKGAGMLLGGLYELHIPEIEYLLGNFLNPKKMAEPLHDLFFSFLNSKIRTHCRTPEAETFYRMAAWRPLGLPPATLPASPTPTGGNHAPTAPDSHLSE